MKVWRENRRLEDERYSYSGTHLKWEMGAATQPRLLARL